MRSRRLLAPGALLVTALLVALYLLAGNRGGEALPSPSVEGAPRGGSASLAPQSLDHALDNALDHARDTRGLDAGDPSGAEAVRERAATLTVRVVDTLGQPLRQGWLRAVPAGKVRGTSHDLARGPAQLALPPGEYRLVLEELPEGVELVPGQPRPGSRSNPVHVTGTSDESVILVVRRSSKLTVQLRAPDGRDLARAMVFVHSIGPGGERARAFARCDPDGLARLEDLEPGTCTVWSSEPCRPLGLELPPGAAREVVLDIDIETVELTGRLIDHTGQALAGHLVQAIPANFPSRQRVESGVPTTTTEEDGTFSLPVAPGLELRLRASFTRAIPSRFGSYGPLLLDRVAQPAELLALGDTAIGSCILDSSEVYLLEGRRGQEGEVHLHEWSLSATRQELNVDAEGRFAWARLRPPELVLLRLVGEDGVRNTIELRPRAGGRERVDL